MMRGGLEETEIDVSRSFDMTSSCSLKLVLKL